ncbi:hypothetical protein HOY34_00945 [Xinfangfangia sp. D13-10-4-6]|uniref:hypothetical protein n=1 Tax=Pseudogemmobacter hezensis TaxID=2737662 RepID=UPI001554BD1F|nr:hypothetical protein [Pseudogemmobacter hezensis]NPD13766.1 hypothetical protein [Pseudogemmobacter hezensis]
MKRFAIIATAAALVAGSANLALASLPDPVITRAAPEIVEAPAAHIKSGKELHQLGLKRTDPVSVTKIPVGERDTRGGRG